MCASLSKRFFDVNVESAAGVLLFSNLFLLATKACLHRGKRSMCLLVHLVYAKYIFIVWLRIASMQV